MTCDLFASEEESIVFGWAYKAYQPGRWRRKEALCWLQSFFFFLVLHKEVLPQQETVLKFNLVRRLESVSFLNDGLVLNPRERK